MGLLNIVDQVMLLHAIFSRNAEEVKFLLLHQEDVNSLDQDHRSPLHAAAYLGDIQIMDLLISSEMIHAVCLLLNHGADADTKDKSWLTPLHVSAANWAIGCADALIPHLTSLDTADKSGRTALLHAAYSGQDEMVDLLLKRGASVGVGDEKERQPIHWAANLGHLEIVKLLVGRGADVMCKDTQGYTPLHAAAGGGQLDVVKYLLTLNVEIDEGNVFGNSALHMACHTGQEAVAIELMNCGANVNQTNHHGYTPLHLAAISTSGTLCLELLVNNAADVNIQSKEGKSPLHMAAIHGRFTRSQILIQNGAEIDCTDMHGNTPLHVAARFGHELLIVTLISNGADVAKQGIDGMLPLHLAALYGFPDCCHKLLTSGGHGRTCLHAAASGGNVDCLNLLLHSGANQSIKDKLGRSPLHYAAANGSSQCTMGQVRGGAEVNEVDLMGCTPLHYAAASHTFSRCLEYLLDNGANPALKNGKGYSAMHFAAAYGNRQHLELVRLLEMSFNCLGEGESNLPVSPLHLAAYNGHCEALRVLTETLVSLDVRDSQGRTALYLAAQRGFARCVEMLLKHGATCLLKDYRRKWTPLHAAAAEGHMDSLLILVNREESADILDSTDIQGQTALMLAALGSHTDCVHILLEKGAAANSADKKGCTALHRAAVMGSEGCVCALLEHGAAALGRDSQGRTPLHQAACCGHTQLLGYLIKAAVQADTLDCMLDFSGYTPTHWAAYHGHEECLRILLENKPLTIQEGHSFTPLHCALGPISSAGCVPWRFSLHRSPLHAAAYSEKVDGLQLVLDQGAEVNAVDGSGRSALMVAADRGQSMAVEMLLQQAKPDLTLLDVNNNTALHLACSKGHEMCALLILGEISDTSLINAANCALQMPLHIAARKGLATVVQVLLSRGAAVMAVDAEGCTPALSCAPNKKVADCLALILSMMKPSPPKEASNFNANLKHCGISMFCGDTGNLNHAYTEKCCSSVGLQHCLTE
uniref:Serine/threonine-protein phosphatase 6 regulatory ankyrin repeat subunit C n=1 Tax=Gadus morhua TaxID=8049 RepID=A0A8C5B5F6_GADMO